MCALSDAIEVVACIMHPAALAALQAHKPRIPPDYCTDYIGSRWVRVMDWDGAQTLTSAKLNGLHRALYTCVFASVAFAIGTSAVGGITRADLPTKPELS